MSKSIEWLPTREALKYLENKNMKITKRGLLTAGTRLGFSRKMNDGFHWEFNKSGLFDYYKMKTFSQKKYITISGLAELFKTTYTVIYNNLRNMKIEKKYIEGQIYVNKQRFIEEYKGNCDGKRN